MMLLSSALASDHVKREISFAAQDVAVWGDSNGGKKSCGS
jgi:hypothetical protein